MRVRLPNGVEVASISPGEAEYLYREIFEQQVYLRHGLAIPPNACVIDVGANIGMFALFVAGAFAPQRIVAFEPVPPIFDAMAQNLRGLASAEAICAAVGSTSGELDLTFYPGMPVMSTSYPNAMDERGRFVSQLSQEHPALASESLAFLADRAFSNPQRYTCPVRPLARLVRELDLCCIDFLKIDVEKAERDVIDGMDDHVWAMTRQIVVEVHDVDGRAGDLSEQLRSRGFEVSADTVTVGASVATDPRGVVMLYAKRLASLG